MTDKPKKPKAPLSGAKLAGAIASHEFVLKQALNDCLKHLQDSAVTDPVEKGKEKERITDLGDVLKAANYSHRQAKKAQEKLDALKKIG